MIPIAFRLDDPSPTSDHALETRLLTLFERYALPLSVAVVPFGRGAGGSPVAASRDNVAHLLDAAKRGVIEVLLHGHSHANHRPGGHPPSEFAGRPREAQRALMAEGLAVLEAVFGPVVTGFVPPWNTCDAGTLLAARDAGLEYLSAGLERWRGIEGGVPVVPRTCTLRTGRAPLEEALALTRLEPALVVVMHPDDFREYRDPPAPGEDAGFTALAELEALLECVAQHRDRFAPVLLREMVAEAARRWCPGEVGWLERAPWRLRARLPRHLMYAAHPLRALLVGGLGMSRGK